MPRVALSGYDVSLFANRILAQRAGSVERGGSAPILYDIFATVMPRSWRFHFAKKLFVSLNQKVYANSPINSASRAPSNRHQILSVTGIDTHHKTSTLSCSKLQRQRTNNEMK